MNKNIEIASLLIVIVIQSMHFLLKHGVHTFRNSPVGALTVSFPGWCADEAADVTDDSENKDEKKEKQLFEQGPVVRGAE